MTILPPHDLATTLFLAPHKQGRQDSGATTPHSREVKPAGREGARHSLLGRAHPFQGNVNRHLGAVVAALVPGKLVDGRVPDAFFWGGWGMSRVVLRQIRGGEAPSEENKTNDLSRCRCDGGEGGTTQEESRCIQTPTRGCCCCRTNGRQARKEEVSRLVQDSEDKTSQEDHSASPHTNRVHTHWEVSAAPNFHEIPWINAWCHNTA